MKIGRDKAIFSAAVHQVCVALITQITEEDVSGGASVRRMEFESFTKRHQMVSNYLAPLHFVCLNLLFGSRTIED